ncbi:hypothetical protein BABINDRAFT_67329 [Babjeviella inositovora NRRL Y-12698]|uniref:Transmembrane protein 135 N-terminal domain-containing protein n=1 Tax=Babjeviella inositovora NRRL Y-12698 TaxID=984486 RepID=A0A1E3QIM9_9ASCO|nr:uncharacterized protein BABINDRAFT_67329 [Babjeviella inositovora NRRL Y-12698]ODQ77551.1 hypothetical protein BABINDRAFT_67329 [Babjeviella inositovora NRRL Y-12698]
MYALAKPQSSVWARFIIDRLLKSPSKAFAIAFIYVTLPKFLAKIYQSARLKESKGLLSALLKILANALHPGKFPMFATKLVLGINVLEPFFSRVLPGQKYKRVVPFASALLASLASSLLTFPDYQHHIISKNRFYTLDMTLLLFVRATDTVLSTILAPHTPAWMYHFNDVIFFNACTSVIMFCWFYYPERLPPLYRDWITSAANMDNGLVKALNMLHHEKIRYGECSPNGEERVLVEAAEKFGMHPDVGDLSKTIPIPCALVHSNISDSCEVNALWRFARGLRFGLSLYMPLNALIFGIKLAMNPKNRSRKLMITNIIRSIQSSLRSSSFLATFIALNWYGVCLVRTRLGPRFLTPYFGISYKKFDSLYAVACGSFIAGLSSIVERKQRQKELALFCAPKALSALLPPILKPQFDLGDRETKEPVDNKAELEIEALVFSFSFAVLVAFSKQNPEKIRGIFGKGLQQVF